LVLIPPSPEEAAAVKIALTSTENKNFAAQKDAGPTFMLGGAPRAHEV
jgi:hypothetical protein